MIAAPIYHRTHPYSDTELYLAIMAYLEKNYLFVKLEIDTWLGESKVLIKLKRGDEEPSRYPGIAAEELWHDGIFEDWSKCTPVKVKDICAEFIFRNSLLIGKYRKTLIKDIVEAETSHGSLITTIKFNPVLKQLIDSGRKRVKGIKPLHYASNKRVNLELNEGDLCYFCWNTKNPYVANPAYVFRKNVGSYTIIFFSNQSKGSETSKTEINMGRFINAPADELGSTPEQAVLQRFC